MPGDGCPKALEFQWSHEGKGIDEPYPMLAPLAQQLRHGTRYRTWLYQRLFLKPEGFGRLGAQRQRADSVRKMLEQTMWLVWGIMPTLTWPVSGS